jgi:hypothetical protein
VTSATNGGGGTLEMVRQHKHTVHERNVNKRQTGKQTEKREDFIHLTPNATRILK